MKVKILENVEYSFTGSNVFESIQDKTTPPMDLLVRESIQNSCDAIIKTKPYGIVEFKYNEFDGEKFLSLFNKFSEVDFTKLNKKNKYILIGDKNTTGLLGNHLKEGDGPKNFYNVCYDLMKKSKDGNSGGSWGIGKSVYYRFGAGFCIFYTRTHENGQYINKLSIAYIEDETAKVRHIIPQNNRGIAFFGDLDENNKSKPINDENDINNILEIFNEKCYQGTETGTKIIIPFVDEKKFMNRSINNEDSYFKSTFIEYLKIAIQRWYFPRIKNKKYSEKSILVYVNNEEVVLNEFFSLMQNLYNGDEKDALKYEIKTSNPTMDLGMLYIKKFSSTDVFMTPPYNLPSPYSFFDIDNEITSKPIIGYLRKPGMIINYDNEKWDNLLIEDKEYIVGIIKLNGDFEIHNEVLEKYVRGTEKSNHKIWEDADVDDTPYLSTKNPIKRMFNNVKRYLKDTYKSEDETILETSSSKIKRKYGKMLLPPAGFGDSASIDIPTPGTSPKKPSKTKNNKVEYLGFENGNLAFRNSAYINPKETLEFMFYIQSGSSKFPIEEWLDFKFAMPFKLTKLTISEIVIGNQKVNGTVELDLINKIKLHSSIKQSLEFNCYEIKDEVSGFEFKNICDEAITFSLKVAIQPLDMTYSLSMTSKIYKE